MEVRNEYVATLPNNWREMLGRQAGSKDLKFQGLEHRSTGGGVVSEGQVLRTGETRMLKGDGVRGEGIWKQVAMGKKR
jgi:hypothetical protein